MDDFDHSTPFFDRSEDEMWSPYVDSHQRTMRDAIVGHCPAVYDEQFQPTSRFISRSELCTAHQAVTFANYMGAILNVQLTIAWTQIGYRYGQEVDGSHRLLMQALRKFMRRHGVPNYNYMVFERSETFGLHSHGAIHVPVVVYPQFKRWLERYIKRQDRIGFPRRLHIRRRPETAVARAIEEQWRWFRYCMKGIDPWMTPHERDLLGLAPSETWASFLGLKHRYGGIVTLQRVRISQDMRRKARREAGYPERWYLINDEGRYTDEEYRRGESDRLMEMLRRGMHF